ncbi:hypothetical protein POM88_021260 [Heracleum sosnowskyi]|uniref:Protein kinase domain-containing protein n=1 Tax=Heracleum sosnowskyi TaxID=360622 RepID=A0AAD8ID88_9APIA|nr:hypothetical protein POM88_021260 [Heracleum sosnowskyi]
MQHFQLLVFLICLCFRFSLGHQFLASVASPIDSSESNLAVADLSPTQVNTSPIPKLRKTVPAFGRTNMFATYAIVRTESPMHCAFPIDTRRVLDHQENNDTVGVLENVEDDIGLVLCNQEDDAGGVVEIQRNFPSLKKRDKGMLKFVARKIKAILVVRRGKKNIARQNTDYGISSSWRPTYLKSFTNGRMLSNESSSSLIRLSEETRIPQFSFLKIQAATNSFHPGLVLTYGHQGMVFKGHLDSEEELIPPFDFWEKWAYLSPEQKAQEQLTPKADVYSMGVVLLNVLFDWRQIIMTLARLNNAQEK